MFRDIRLAGVPVACLAGIMSVFSVPAAAQTTVANNVPITSLSVNAFGGTTATVGQTRQVAATANLNDGTTRMLGSGSQWNLSFAPGIPVQNCNTGAQQFSSQGWAIDASGAFHAIWSPGSPNTLVADGTMSMPTSVPNASLSASLSCVSTPPTGSLAAQWSGSHYSGTYTFDGAQGAIAVIGLTWTSSNPAVATVDQFGNVTALAPGDTVIAGTFGSQCWQMMPDATGCVGTSSGSVTIHVDAAGPGGGGDGGGDDGGAEGCATLTFGLAAGSASVTEVTFSAVDLTTAEEFGPFTAPIGVALSVPATSLRLRFTAPEGHTVEPGQVDLTVTCGAELTVSLRFDPEGSTPTIDSLTTQALSVNFATDLLKNARSRLMAGNVTAACNQLGAFMHQAGAQSGKTLSQESAAALLASAASLRTALGCR
ncbi:MAG TPA: Ig-like domain-containing protein [Vicinamibacterales bacterium]|nr:Ig-like domain-containing protein [Vicinamibacterales bacterium]